jgi:hypothetical protein
MIEQLGMAKVAMDMAHYILLNIENRDPERITRDEYLRTVVQCVEALRGVAPAG